MQDRHQQATEHRAPDAANAAEHQAGVDQDQDRRLEVGREDVALLRGEHGPGQRRDHRAEAERHHLDGVGRDRHHPSRELVVADGPPRPPGSRLVEQV